MPKAPKSTWKECRDYTIRNHPTWISGGGARSAIMYSGKLVDSLGHSPSMDPTKISYRMMLEDCNTLVADGMKHASVNRYISAVSTILKVAQKVKLISKDWEIPRFERFKEAADAGERNSYTEQQLDAMIDFAENKLHNEDLADIILFAALTGIRQGRILALKPNDFNFVSQSIRVTKPKDSNVKERWCGLHDELVPMVKLRISSGRKRLFGDDWLPDKYKLKASRRYADDAYYQYAGDVLRRQFKKCLTYTGLTDGTYNFHGLRHTYGTFMIQAGINIADVAQQMGHSTTSTTERYLHASTDLASQVNKVKYSRNYSDRSSWKHTRELQAS